MEAMLAWLAATPAAELPHGSRTLLEHLVGVRDVVRRWGGSPALQAAALFHSVYGTEVYEPQAVPLTGRDAVRAVAGGEGERLAWLFCTTPRSAIVDGTAPEADALRLLLLANRAEQATGPWLADATALAPAVPGAPEALLLPVSAADEETALAAWRWAAGDATRLAQVAMLLPVGEPCVELSLLAKENGDLAGAGWWAGEARRRFEALGVVWDRRRSWEGWHAALDGPAPPVSADRFSLYCRGFAAGSDPMKRRYPGLLEQPWWDGDPVATFLEEHAEAIRAEVAGLDGFAREAENLDREGEWGVLFFHERGRRVEENLARCPTVARALALPDTVKTAAGLAYLSRLRPGAHVKPHRGPTNLRLRVHLGIDVPAGDCGLRVGGEIRRWEAGRCLVFDDSFEHEAWNRTGSDRLVLIVDVWHPGLSGDEVALLSGLQRYAVAHARDLSRYWAANAAARAE